MQVTLFSYLQLPCHTSPLVPSLSLSLFCPVGKWALNMQRPARGALVKFIELARCYSSSSFYFSPVVVICVLRLLLFLPGSLFFLSNTLAKKETAQEEKRRNRRCNEREPARAVAIADAKVFFFFSYFLAGLSHAIRYGCGKKCCV